MSRDQRPGRVSVVDAATAAAPARRVDDAPPIDTGAPLVADGTKPSSHVLLWSVLFLSACTAGALGVALLPMLGVG